MEPASWPWALAVTRVLVFSIFFLALGTGSEAIEFAERDTNNMNLTTNEKNN